MITLKTDFTVRDGDYIIKSDGVDFDIYQLNVLKMVCRLHGLESLSCCIQKAMCEDEKAHVLKQQAINMLIKGGIKV